MVYGCASKTVKCLVFFFNFLAFICGLALVIAGVVGFLSTNVYTKVLADVSGDANEKFKFVLFIAVGLGAALALLGFLGCCGAWCENQCLLGSFVTVMVIMLIVQLVVGILALVYRDRIKKEINENLENTLTQLPDAEPAKQNATCEMWKLLQTSLSCCGKNGDPDDNLRDICHAECVSHDMEAVQPGCPVAFWDFFMKYGTVIGGVILGFIGLELIAVIFGCCLCCEIRKASDTY